MKKAPKITIVTPSYNQGRFIAETIESVLSQAGDFYIEYIIMDGGSTDNSVEVIRKYDSLLKEGKWPVKCLGITCSWESEKDKGQSDAVNKGFSAATGEILGWLNSDDTYIPSAFKKVADYLKAHEDVGMVYGEGYHIKDTGEVIERYPTEPFDSKRLAETCFICQPTVFLRREVLDKVGYLDASLNYCMDYEYWIRIAKKGLKAGFMPAYLANSRMYGENKTMSKRAEVHYEIVMTVKKHFGYVPETWITGYVDSYLEKWLSRDTRLKNYIYLKLRGIFYRCMILRFNYNSRNAGLI